MAQNIYDDESFFAAYSRLRRSVQGLEGAPEWPTLRAMLPDLPGRRVLDLGCGFGWFCRWAATAGATSVLGLDLSERMLTRARADTADDRIRYERCDLDALDLPPAAFDVAYSSLAMHYVVALPQLLATVQQALVAGSVFVFSVEHPIVTAPTTPRFVCDGGGRPSWPLARYQDEGPRPTEWLGSRVVKQHRTITSYFDALRTAGFVVTALIEWSPSAEQVAAEPDWAPDRERPFFLLVRADRP